MRKIKVLGIINKDLFLKVLILIYCVWVNILIKRCWILMLNN